MSILTGILQCLRGITTTEQKPFNVQSASHRSLVHNDEEVVAHVLGILRTAEKVGPGLQSRVRAAIGTQSWTESIARRILDGMVDIVQEGRAKMGPAMAEALQKVETTANEVFKFTKDHPETVAAIFVVVVALGLLVFMGVPWVVSALGFGELGPMEGSFAAWWESQYAGFIPKGSVFSFLQKLGMTWAAVAGIRPSL